VSSLRGCSKLCLHSCAHGFAVRARPSPRYSKTWCRGPGWNIACIGSEPEELRLDILNRRLSGLCSIRAPTKQSWTRALAQLLNCPRTEVGRAVWGGKRKKSSERLPVQASARQPDWSAHTCIFPTLVFPLDRAFHVQKNMRNHETTTAGSAASWTQKQFRGHPILQEDEDGSKYRLEPLCKVRVTQFSSRDGSALPDAFWSQ